MTTRQDGKHYKINELYESDIITLMDIETWYAEEKRKEDKRKEKGIQGTISPDEFYDRW